ncbi:hypothetical protein CDV31_001626 [Fusarium ambrosium]|uniref:Heterokaryon incompatibility domain-containing protein n=1 Tax=Fusarium ambrosium TaxID=131363 RepID=A0A428UZ01_9HYPO|nr:hypothetical protein CDV31_001626 [Fusarium ambrosium]
MRLINVRTMELKEFFRDQIPKLKRFQPCLPEGRQAREDSLEYLYVDTNCIDKTSSAELSEAINSMFNWYSYAEICYVFLIDVPTIPTSGLVPLNEFCQSRWFTRGYTPKNFQYGLLFATPNDVLQRFHLWDSQRSLIMFPTQNSEPRKVFAVMVQIQMQPDSGLVMLFAIRIRWSGEVLWFCRLFELDKVESSFLKLTEDFKEEVSKRTEGIMCSGHECRKFHLDILSGLNISSGVVVHAARLSTKDDLSGDSDY